MVRQQEVQIEEIDTAQRTKNIHGHLALRSRRTVFVIVCECVCVRSRALTEPWGHQNIPYRELWSASLCCLHLPMQPNLSQRTKSCQIRRDSYRSISSPQTCQLHGGRDYAKGEGDSPISRLWGSLRHSLAYQTCSDVSLLMHRQTQTTDTWKIIFNIYICVLRDI